MKVLIAYSSKTGNTEKIAKEISQYNKEWELLKISEIGEQTDLSAYDLIFVGGWIDKGTYNKECLDFAKMLKGKMISFFFTLGAYPTSKHAYDCITNIQELFLENGNEVINHYHCQGAIDGKLTEWMKKLPKGHGHAVDEYRTKRWENAAKHPNQEDYDATRNFADVTIKYYQKRMEQ